MKFYRIFEEEQARELAAQIAGDEWQEGRARTKELTGTVKQNEEILGSGNKILEELGRKIVNHPAILLDHLPLKCHTPKFSRYKVGGDHYGVHTDAPWMGSTRTDLSCTLWLNDGYEGGELVIDDRKLKGKPGTCVVYDCGEPHEVLPVTAGERICAITWIQSRIRDAHKRQLVSNFRKLLAKMEKEKPDWFLEGGQVYSSLLRMWWEN